VADVRAGSLDELALPHVHATFPELRADDTVEQALASVRSQPCDSPLVCFYVVDDDRRLHGLVSMRVLLGAERHTRISSLMSDAAITLPATATLRDAAALLAHHRLLVVPVVGCLGRMHGVIDAATLGVLMVAERDAIFTARSARIARRLVLTLRAILR
jgi:magnesium transporter